MDSNVKEKLLESLPKIESFMRNSKHVISSANSLTAVLREGIAPKYIVVFLVHHLHAWYAIADLYQVMKDSSTFLPIVVSIPHKYGVLQFHGEDEVHEFLTREGVPHIRFNFDGQYEGLRLLKNISPEIVIRQAPWEHNISPAYSIHNLRFTRLLYTDYGMEVFDGLYGWKHYRTPLHYRAWMILCDNEVQKEYYLSQNPELKSLCVTGYPKFDALCRRMEEGSFWPVKNSRKGKFRVIYSPHHTVTRIGPSFATFHEVYKDILHLATVMKDVEFVFRPHPELLEHPAPEECPNLKEMLAQFMNEWDKLPNTGMSVDGDYALLFAASDCMVTDGISFLAEYPLTGKPCIFLENQEHWPFNMVGEKCMSSTYRLTDVKKLGGLIEKLAQEKKEGRKDKLFKQREKVIRFLRPYPGQAAKRAIKCIEKKLNEEKKCKP